MTYNSDNEIYNAQSQSELAHECYIRGGQGNSVVLVCHRRECRVLTHVKYREPMLSPFEEVLPDNCIPEFAVLRRAKHLQTHTEV